ncbi:DNA-3-methyladenine glycosylase family protein [Curvivirga aplysinae]|uniref:DNA-3-methyladenine glycosylase family protein n=1 Tax=Curvivirga aplysinae TaxID=2529852 RepID=UPI0012BBE696|nr:DNA-3-methyladenine glycosylase [Curvivirga aplysinae]MTI09477.1 DNA-3-methyladenine glycosylase 2 family protein [Curvivirga aplysinae]
MNYPVIDEPVIKHALHEIAKADPDVKKGMAIMENPYPAPRIRPDGFPALLNSVGSQQISIHAAKAILDRVDALMPKGVTSNAFLEIEFDTLREAGLSIRKIEYLRGIAEAELSGALNYKTLCDLSDDDVIKTLSSLRGIGKWTAEIYAMFSLNRPDVFPADDLALQEALRRLKGLKDRPSGKQSRELVKAWTPWRGVGALFLWHYYKGAPRDADGDM